MLRPYLGGLGGFTALSEHLVDQNGFNMIVTMAVRLPNQAG